MKMSEEEMAIEEMLEVVTDPLGNPILKSELVDVDTSNLEDVSYGAIVNVLRRLQGQVLTIIDATFVDERRLKYVKDMVKNNFAHAAESLLTLKEENK